jgi:TPR repeat protein
LGVEQDHAKAFELFHRAVDADNTTAMFNLALLYLDPDSGHYDISRAASLLKKCVLAGIAEARDLLADLHLEEAPRA